MSHLHTNTYKVAHAQVLNTGIPFQGEGKKEIYFSFLSFDASWQFGFQLIADFSVFSGTWSFLKCFNITIQRFYNAVLTTNMYHTYTYVYRIMFSSKHNYCCILYMRAISWGQDRPSWPHLYPWPRASTKCCHFRWALSVHNTRWRTCA